MLLKYDYINKSGYTPIVTLAQFKEQLKKDGTDDDTINQVHLDAAISYVEYQTSYFLQEKEVTLVTDIKFNYVQLKGHPTAIVSIHLKEEGEAEVALVVADCYELLIPTQTLKKKELFEYPDDLEYVKVVYYSDPIPNKSLYKGAVLVHGVMYDENREGMGVQDSFKAERFISPIRDWSWR